MLSQMTPKRSQRRLQQQGAPLQQMGRQLGGRKRDEQPMAGRVGLAVQRQRPRSHLPWQLQS